MGHESKSRDRVERPARRGWAPLLSIALAAVGGCAPAETGSTTDPVVKKIEGAPAAVAMPVARIELASDKPAALSSLHGAIALGTSTGLLAGSLADDPPAAVQLVPDDGGPTTTGAVDVIARRSGGGLLVHGASGLFHDTDGFLVPSPLEKSLAGKPIVAIDAFGKGLVLELLLHAGGFQIVDAAVRAHVGSSRAETCQFIHRK